MEAKVDSSSGRIQLGYSDGIYQQKLKLAEANYYHKIHANLKKITQFPKRISYFIESSSLHGIRFLNKRNSNVDR